MTGLRRSSTAIDNPESIDGSEAVDSFRRSAWRFGSGRYFPCRSAIAFVALALALGGCQSTGMGDITGSLGLSKPGPVPTDPGALRVYAEGLGRTFDSHPDDKEVALAYARALKGLTQYAQAVAVLQRVAVKHPHDLDLLGAYGKALADAGRLQEAADVLERSHTPDRPNWTVLSAQGSVADQLGNHEQAQGYYMAALKIAPDQPEILSNLGLSYALQRQMANAEQTLRSAAAQPAADMRVRQNLALVLALQGKFSEAEAISRRDLTPIDAAANVASIRRMIAQSDTWKDLKTLDRRKVAARDHVAKTRTAASDDPQ